MLRGGRRTLLRIPVLPHRLVGGTHPRRRPAAHRRSAAAAVAAVELLAALSAGATSALLVILAECYLRAGPGGFGLLLGAIGAGVALGPLLLARLTSNPLRPALVFGPYLLRGLVDLILATTRSVPVAMAALGLCGVGTSTGMVTYNSLPQAEVPAKSAAGCSLATT